jgi:hypothetical protein
MIWISTSIEKGYEFRELFRKTHEHLTFLDLSKISTKDLANECESIVNHHKECAIFLGYIEPGWMLELPHQTKMRKLIRKFPVAFLSLFLESIPFSWKTETEYIYVNGVKLKDGATDIINDGSPV